MYYMSDLWASELNPLSRLTLHHKKENFEKKFGAMTDGTRF